MSAPRPTIVYAMGWEEASAIGYQLNTMLASLDPVLSDAIDSGDGPVIAFMSHVRTAAKMAAEIEARGRPVCPLVPPRKRGVILTKR